MCRTITRNAEYERRQLVEGFRFRCHSRKWADSEWAAVRMEARQNLSKDYEVGFKDGFIDFVEFGPPGEPPALPPPHYLTSRYESPIGQAAIADWFAGFRHGVVIARAKGYRQLIVPPTSLANVDPAVQHLPISPSQLPPATPAELHSTPTDLPPPLSETRVCPKPPIVNEKIESPNPASLGKPSVTEVPEQSSVVVSSQAPIAEVRLMQATADGQVIQVELRNPNLDQTKTQVWYQTKDQAWRGLEPMFQQPTHYCIPIQAATTGRIRVSAADRAGNAMQRDYDLGNSSVGKLIPEGAGSALSTKPGNPLNPAAPASIPGIPPPLAASQPPVGPFAPTDVSKANPPAPEPIKSVEKKSASLSADRQLINDVQVLLGYHIEEAGSSGVGKVEVWITRDQSKTWRKLCEDPDRKSPLAIELPGEGLYGITFVVSNGRGFGSPPPKTGDAPESWIEVDLTNPVAEITSVRPGTGEDAGAMFISWSAKDRNLATDSVELFFSSSRGGSWRSIAKGLKNEGMHRWVPPSNFGPQAFLRLVVRDLAGNITVVEPPQPVALDDLSRPRGQ